MAYILTVAATGADTSERFSLKLSDCPATISAPGLATTEVVDLHIRETDGTYAATGVQLTATTNTKAIIGPGDFKTVKSTTAAAVGVSLFRNENI